MDPTAPPQQISAQPLPSPAAQPEEKKTSALAGMIGSILTIGLLFVFFPLGLLTMWFFTKWPKIVKIIITLFFLIVGGILTLEGITIYNALKENAARARSNPGYEPTKTVQPKGYGLGAVQQAARDTLRKGDIQAIAKIYEADYNSKTKMYKPLEDSDFAGGKIPKDPKTGSGYQGLIATSSARFNVCATLETVTPAQFCLESQK
jgi:predicted lipid-binding transport protein (Tim44 family)